jgi:hypothetical protein
MRAGQEGIKIAGVTGIRAWKKRDRERGHRTKNIFNLEENSRSCLQRKDQKLCSTPFMIEGREGDGRCQDFIGSDR